MASGTERHPRRRAFDGAGGPFWRWGLRGQTRGQLERTRTAREDRRLMQTVSLRTIVCGASVCTTRGAIGRLPVLCVLSSVCGARTRAQLRYLAERQPRDRRASPTSPSNAIAPGAGTTSIMPRSACRVWLWSFQTPPIDGVYIQPKNSFPVALFGSPAVQLK